MLSRDVVEAIVGEIKVCIVVKHQRHVRVGRAQLRDQTCQLVFGKARPRKVISLD